jgi:hypothetical protein
MRREQGELLLRFETGRRLVARGEWRNISSARGRGLIYRRKFWGLLRTEANEFA